MSSPTPKTSATEPAEVTAAPTGSTGKLPQGLTWLAVGTFALGTEAFVIAGVLPQIADELDVGRSTAGLLVALFALTYGLSAPVMSRVTARYNPRTVLRATMALFVVANLAAAAAPTFAVLLVARMVAAVSASAFTPTASATASGLAGPEHRGRALALVFGGMSLAMVAGVPIGTILSNIGSWRTTFVFVALLGTIATVGIHLYIPDTRLPASKPQNRRLGFLRTPAVARCLTVSVLIFAGDFAVFTYLADLIVDLYGNPTVSIPAALLVTGAAGAIGNNLSGKLTDSLGAEPALRIALIGTHGGLLTLAISSLLDGMAAALVAALGLLLWSVAAWGFGPPQQTRLLELAPDAPTAALGANASATQLGIGIGGLIGAATIAATSTGWLPAVGAAFTLVAIVTNRASQHRANPSPAPESSAGLESLFDVVP